MDRLFMVDVENVPSVVGSIKYCSFTENDKLALFFNNTHTAKMLDEFGEIEKVFNHNVEYINTSGNSTKNALDFNICLYAGIAIGNYEGECLELHIISQDQGYRAIKGLVLQCRMPLNVVLLLMPRSGQGFKCRLQLNNTVGVIDSDYYFAENEGHIMVKLTNDSNEGKVLEISKGDAICQGIFTQYLTTEDDNSSEVRTGGMGSTGR